MTTIPPRETSDTIGTWCDQEGKTLRFAALLDTLRHLSATLSSCAEDADPNQDQIKEALADLVILALHRHYTDNMSTCIADHAHGRRCDSLQGNTRLIESMVAGLDRDTDKLRDRRTLDRLARIISRSYQIARLLGTDLQTLVDERMAMYRQTGGHPKERCRG